MSKTAQEIRDIFLQFFAEKGHTIVPSAPMVNKDDPTLMFTNAGMNPFKDFFLGHKPPSHKRIADAQKCLRVSGKHNDLEEVGRDGYHHTMFEMLGNWSFGDYFKKEAIDWAWELLTVRLGIPVERIYTSYFGGDDKDGLPKDDEAQGYWSAYLPAERILPFSKKDNFWEMGDTGPCGPCSEIHVDLRSDEERAATPGGQLVNADHPSVIEIWNLVFIQFNRQADGSLAALPAKHVDTGMGFERLVRVLQQKSSNYDTDIFSPLIHYVEQATGIQYTGDYSGSSMSDIAMRVLADHVRAVCFGIADGEMPSNTGAGYVLRRILRRAVRYYYTFLQTRDPLMHRLVPLLVEFFGSTYPDFAAQQDFVKKVIEQEEISFLRTLEAGIKRFESIQVKDKSIPGQEVFELYDTYGFPADLTRLMASEKGWSVDEKGFEDALQQQKQRSRADASKQTGDWIDVNPSAGSPVFQGYDQDEIPDAKFIKYRMIEDRDGVRYQVVLDKTSFYPEGGGQVGDTGVLHFGNEAIPVIDMIKENDLPIHITNKLPAAKQEPVRTSIDTHRRRLIENNHSATHLLHAALRDVLGDHVQQRGSLLDDQYLRFDFSHFSKVSDEDISRIEAIVNQRIRDDIRLQEERSIPIQQAQQAGARMLFGEKYGERVRMITFDPSFSIELCGGCHVPATGRIGFFKILSESAVAAGVRRIEAITAEAAEQYIHDQLNQLNAIRQELKNPPDPIRAIRELQQQVKEMRQQLEQLELQKASSIKDSLLNQVEQVNGIKLVRAEVALQDQKLLKSLLYQLGQELGDQTFLLLGARAEGKAQLMLYISEDLVKGKRLHAGNIIKDLARSIDGGGGGQPFFASAGGTAPEGLGDALERAKGFIEN
jgi:alanyl-tRNA synthetase